jgi:hypothetical protein
MRELILPAIVAWVAPLVCILVVRFTGPDYSQPKEGFPNTEFTPATVEAVKKAGSNGSDYFELWLHSPDGSSYFMRDPEPEPIESLRNKIPENKTLSVVYSKTIEGNVLMDITLSGDPAGTILSFADRAAEYARRVRIVYIVSGIWFSVGTLLLVGFWFGERESPSGVQK